MPPDRWASRKSHTINDLLSLNRPYRVNPRTVDGTLAPCRTAVKKVLTLEPQEYV